MPIAKKLRSVQELVQAARKRRGWTYDILAEKLRGLGIKCDQRTVWAWGSGREPRENTQTILRPALERLLKGSS